MRAVENMIAARLNRGERVYIYSACGQNVENHYILTRIAIYVSSESGGKWYYLDN
jgi:hypothetical protein